LSSGHESHLDEPLRGVTLAGWSEYEPRRDVTFGSASLSPLNLRRPLFNFRNDAQLAAQLAASVSHVSPNWA
jgi:hypothetical protein